MEKRQITVFVAGQRFNIITDEEEKYVIDIASKIDARIASIAISNNMSRERAAVLAALDLADDGEQGRRELNEIKEQVKDYLTRIEKLTAENNAVKAEMSRTKLDSDALDDARKTIADKTTKTHGSFKARSKITSAIAPIILKIKAKLILQSPLFLVSQSTSRTTARNVIQNS